MTKKVLLLGSGFVAQPVVDILSKETDVELTVGCRHIEAAKELAKPENLTISVDATDLESLTEIVAKYDLVISLIPYIYHANVVKAAIKGHTDVVTTSYTSDALKALEPEIKAAGIVVMNEIGLDPGIDHLYALKTINEAHAAGAKVKTFILYCGGLPAPEDSDNPLGYKFSWSARGVLLALRNSAKFYRDGKLVNIAAEDLMDSTENYVLYPGYAFVSYPNRDSTTYRDLYNIPEADTCERGTLRYQGFPEFAKVLIDLGFLSEEPKACFQKAQPWNVALAEYIGAKSSSKEDLVAKIDELSSFKSKEDRERILYGLGWLGLFSDKVIKPTGNAIDTICADMEELMQFGPKERDLVALQEKFVIEYPDGTTKTKLATMIDYGVPGGYSSMAKLVGVPCAVGCQLVLRHQGTFAKPGLYYPANTPDMINPLIDILRDDYGISCIEKTL